MTTAARTIDLSLLTRAQGFVVQGYEDDQAGFSVSSAGDVNGDGIDDVIIGAPEGDTFEGAGKAFVVFGQAKATRPSIDVLSFSATDGFKIQGDSAYDGAGWSVSSAGDVNGDGIDDLIIGAPGPSEAYVIFGKAAATRTNIDVSTLSAEDGFIIHGDSARDVAGQSVSAAGDVNGDGIDDLIIGAPFSDDGGVNAGEAYVIFGMVGATRANIDLATLAVADGFIIQGDSTDDRAGQSVSSAGDVNGDGIDDLIVGARYGDNGGINSGEAYVIFGMAGATRANIDLTTLAAADGFIIQGDSADDRAGCSVSSAGDVNGDGIDDMIVGAQGGDNGGSSAGEAYVIFGKAAAMRANIDLTTLAAADGFIIQGDRAGDSAGLSVSSAGDVNGDGIDDLIFGSPNGDNGGYNAGEAYVIFGKAGATRTNIDLSTLAASDGFVVNGETTYDYAGHTVSSAGDVNGDGFDDLIVGALDGERFYINPGKAYIIYGSAAIGLGGNITGTDEADRLDGTEVGERMYGLKGNDILYGLRGGDDMRGGRGNDRLVGGRGNDSLQGNGGRDVLTGGLGQDTFHFSNAGGDRIADFTIGADTLSISASLTGGLTDAATAIASFATVVDSDVVFDFGGGQTIRLTDLGTTAGLADDVLIV